LGEHRGEVHTATYEGKREFTRRLKGRMKGILSRERKQAFLANLATSPPIPKEPQIFVPVSGRDGTHDAAFIAGIEDVLNNDLPVRGNGHPLCD
jgi:hypothetical protein